MLFNEKWHFTTIFTLVGWNKPQVPISYKWHDVNNDIIKKFMNFVMNKYEKILEQIIYIWFIKHKFVILICKNIFSLYYNLVYF